jgi:hypothetical protein
MCGSRDAGTQCCAIDYMVHTLDGTSALLCLDKAFPLRTSIPSASVHYFQSIMRRLFRIFSHAYYHHRDVYDQFEAEHRLCKRFVAFSLAFNLLTKDQFIFPVPT